MAQHIKSGDRAQRPDGSVIVYVAMFQRWLSAAEFQRWTERGVSCK